MRVRHAVIGLTLGSSLALGGISATAEAAGLPEGAHSSVSGAQAAAPDWHYHSTYYNAPSLCENAGKATGLPYKCVGGLPGAVLPIFLYVWY
ncbi:hypothetical protein [Streptomyces sp. NPDC058157]|uniref:hypothetical protein n=1 Tax=Streptomyces sp. NPDC058157 TaxID=3346360 RepID=UPI0036E42C06